MSQSTEPRPSAPPSEGVRAHAQAYRAMATRQLGGAIAVATLAVGLGYIGVPFGAAGLFAIALLYAWAAHQWWTTYPVVMTVNRAYQALGRGDLEAWASELRQLPPGAQSIRYLARTVLLQRAIAAFQEGKPEGVREYAAGARTLPWDSWYRRHVEKNCVSSAAGLEAMAEATLGNDDAARQRILEVRFAEAPSAEALARAAVAEATLHARAQDLDALARVLREHRRLLFEATTPRERDLVRTMQRLLLSRKRSPYRESVEPTTEVHDEAAWMAGWFPDAAPFSPSARGTGELSEAAAYDNVAAHAPLPSAKSLPAALSRRRIALLFATMVVLISVILVYVGFGRDYVVFGRDDTVDAGGLDALLWPMSTVWLDILGVVLAATVFGTMLVLLRRERRVSELLMRVQTTLVTGGDTALADAHVALAPTIRSRKSLQGNATARLILARGHRRIGEFEDALRLLDEGVVFQHDKNGRPSPLTRELHYPDLVADRAAMLALMGKTESAWGALAELEREFPGFAYLPRARFDVHLCHGVARNDLSAAAEAARAKPSAVPVSASLEFLADAVLACQGALSRIDLERMQEDLAVDGALRAFMQRGAPTVLQALEDRLRALEQTGTVTH